MNKDGDKYKNGTVIFLFTNMPRDEEQLRSRRTWITASNQL